MTRARPSALFVALAAASCAPARAPHKAVIGPHFTVVSTGRAPRRALRHAFHVGPLAPLEVSSVTRVLKDDREVALAFVEAPLASRIESLEPGGGARFTFSLGPIELGVRGDQRVVRLLVPRGPRNREIDVRLTGSGFIDARGVLSGVALDEQPTPALRLAFALAASALAGVTPFPRSAVGEDARWQSVTRAHFGDSDLTLTARYRLIASPPGAARWLVRHDEPLTLGDPPKLSVRASAGEWTFLFDQVFPRGFERLTHPLVQGLVVASEVHVGAH
jgi:hypothetical protein